MCTALRLKALPVSRAIYHFTAQVLLQVLRRWSPGSSGMYCPGVLPGLVCS